MELAGKTCLVTGPAQGIGAAVARELAGRGARLVLAGLEPERISELAAVMEAEALALEMDVADTGSVERAVAAGVERFGGLDVVVNNAGIGPLLRMDELDEETFRRTLEVNLTGVFRVTKAALPALRASRGHIAIVASLAAKISPPGLAHYAASKAGVAGFGKVLAAELAPDGVGVTVVYFGTIDTPMVAEVMKRPDVRDQVRRARRWGMMPLIPAERAARAIVGGIEAERRAVVLPRRARLFWALPELGQRVVDRLGSQVA